MMVLLSLGIFWTLYGVAGLLGFQRINERYKRKSWTKKYIQSCGIGWLMMGIPWIALYLLWYFYQVQWSVIALLMILFSVPSIVYSFCIEKKYKSKIAEDAIKEQPDCQSRTE